MEWLDNAILNSHSHVASPCDLFKSLIFVMTERPVVHSLLNLCYQMQT